jgi:metal-responsive CopG/Arc/MetJ family transcriptional regulator
MGKQVATKIWASIPDRLAEKLDQRAESEGRSRSDLISYLLERSMESWTPPIEVKAGDHDG